MLETLSAIDDDIIFNCMKPFHFFLLHHTSPLVMFEGRFVQPENADGDKIKDSDIGSNDEALLFNNNDDEDENKQHQTPSKTTWTPSLESTIKNNTPTRGTFQSENQPGDTDQESIVKPVTENVNENLRPVIHETTSDFQQDQAVNNYTLNNPEHEEEDKKKGNFITNAIKKIINLFN